MITLQRSVTPSTVTTNTFTTAARGDVLFFFSEQVGLDLEFYDVEGDEWVNAGGLDYHGGYRRSAMLPAGKYRFAAGEWGSTAESVNIFVDGNGIDVANDAT